MNNNMIRTLSRIVFAVLMIAGVFMAFADEDVPIAAEGLNEMSDEILNASQFLAASHPAMAGNVTNLTINGISQTRHWQGYYGEITGTITLDDAQNWTMYDWYNDEPRGEVYAVPNISAATPPTWSTVKCFNYSEPQGGAEWPDDDHAENGTILARWEWFYNMSWADPDGINETFDDYDHPAFSVGDYPIAADSCPSIYTFVEDQAQSDKFSEILLQTDNSQIIYATIIENDNAPNRTDPIGFDGLSHDFQMLVGEDGTSFDGATGQINLQTTTYYFYLDLE